MFSPKADESFCSRRVSSASSEQAENLALLAGAAGPRGCPVPETATSGVPGKL